MRTGVWVGCGLGVVSVGLGVGLALLGEREEGPAEEGPAVAVAPLVRSSGSDDGFRPEVVSGPYGAVRSPEWVDAETAAKALKGEESVLGVEVGGEARAYPLGLMRDVAKEALNDTLGGRAVLVTWCTMCQSGVVFSREVGGRVLEFRLNGQLWKRNMVMEDLETRTSWSQVLGQGMKGPLRGSKLERLPSVVTDWATWRNDHPATTVLSTLRSGPNWNASQAMRYPEERAEEFLLGWEVAGKAVGWTLGTLWKRPVVNEVVEWMPVVVVFDRASRTASLYDRRLEGRTLTFRESGGGMEDAETGSWWNRRTGRAERGALAGRSLTGLPGMVMTRTDWLRFHPETEVRGVREEGGGRAVE